MRVTPLASASLLIFSTCCLAQQWEMGATGGYGWNYNTSIGVAGQSASAGFRQGAAVGAVFGENMYGYIGGEIRYLYRWGTPELQFQGAHSTIGGYSNIVVYDLLVHTAPRDSRVRPYLAGGAGIKIFTGSHAQPMVQPLIPFAVLLPGTQVEPAISVGGGLKYRMSRHALLRADFRTYMTPLPNQLFKPTGPSVIRGWVFDFVPLVGISYTF